MSSRRSVPRSTARPKEGVAVPRAPWQTGAVTTENPVEPPPDHVRELALGAVQFVQRATGVQLDFDPETLPLLDHYLSSVSEASEAVLALVAPAAGAYFGEVVRKVFPARWSAPGEDYAVWRIEFSPCFLHFNPVAFAHEAIHARELIEGGTGFGVNSDDVDTVRQSLEVLGTVSEEDYFKLSTRFEVLTSVVDRLIASATARGEPPLSLGAEMYRSALDTDAATAS